MVTITTEYGTFTASTSATARKLARQAEKQAKQEKERVSAAWRHAYAEAERNGFALYRCLAEISVGERDRLPWVLDTKNTTYSVEAGETGDVITVETLSGDRRQEFFGHRVSGVICGCLCCALFVVTRSLVNGREYVSAIGTHDDQIVALPCPGVSVEEIRKHIKIP